MYKATVCFRRTQWLRTGMDPADPSNYMGMRSEAHKNRNVGSCSACHTSTLSQRTSIGPKTDIRFIADGSDLGELGSSGESGDGFHTLAAPNLAIFQCPSNPVSIGQNGKNSYVSNNGLCHGSNIDNDVRYYVLQAPQQRANGAFNCKYNVTSVNMTTGRGRS